MSQGDLFENAKPSKQERCGWMDTCEEWPYIRRCHITHPHTKWSNIWQGYLCESHDAQHRADRKAGIKDDR